MMMTTTMKQEMTVTVANYCRPIVQSTNQTKQIYTVTTRGSARSISDYTYCHLKRIRILREWIFFRHAGNFAASPRKMRYIKVSAIPSIQIAENSRDAQMYLWTPLGILQLGILHRSRPIARGEGLVLALKA